MLILIPLTAGMVHAQQLLSTGRLSKDVDMDLEKEPQIKTSRNPAKSFIEQMKLKGRNDLRHFHQVKQESSVSTMEWISQATGCHSNMIL